MIKIKKPHGIRIGLGTIISLIIAYFILKYATQQGWTLLALIAKIYLYLYLAIAILIVVIILFVLLIIFLSFLIFKKNFKFSKTILNKKRKDKKTKEYIDAEYKVIK